MTPAAPRLRPFTVERDAGPGLVVVLSAPSGAGKTTVGEAVLARRDTLARCVTLTTRAPRNGEADGAAYHFVDEREFARRRDRGTLLEWAAVHEHLYGTPKRTVRARQRQRLDTLLIIDVQGGLAVRERLPEAILIFLVPPAAAELERRLRGRGTDPAATIARRLRNATRELRAAKAYDYTVVNDDVAQAAATIDAILTAEHARAGRTKVRWPRT